MCVKFILFSAWPEEKSKADKVRRKAPRFWLSEDRKLYKRSFSGPCFVCTLKHQNHFWRSCTKGFMEVIQEEDPCLIGLLPKDIGGQTCKKRRKNMSRNAINVRGLRPIFTSLEGFSTFFLVRGLLLNGAWTLWDLSPKQWKIKNTSWSIQIISLSGSKLNL